MSLRHFFIASSLILAPITTLGFGSAAFANTATDSIQLSGTVESQIAIDATPTQAAADLPLSPEYADQNGWNMVQIADLNITSNNTEGITITASSTNDSELVSTTNSSDKITYGIAIVDSGAATPTSSSPLNNVSVPFSQSVTSGFNSDTGVKAMDLYIHYMVGGMPKQGTYTDTLTITVSDN